MSSSRWFTAAGLLTLTPAVLSFTSAPPPATGDPSPQTRAGRAEQFQRAVDGQKQAAQERTAQIQAELKDLGNRATLQDGDWAKL
jgi:hypothetical protein